MVTSKQIAEWRRQLAEEGDGEYLDPTVAQVIAPKLIDEVELLQSLVRKVAVERGVCLYCGPVEPYGHARRCPAAPYLEEPSRQAG